jgi:hypothetical protein
MNWVGPAIAFWFLLLTSGAAMKEHRFLEINAPVIAPTNPELR